MLTKPMRLHHTIRSDIPVHSKAIEIPDAYGVEVELEGKNVINKTEMNIGSWWVMHPDGSLRAIKGGESIEYIFKYPLNINDTEKAVNVLFDYLNTAKVKVFPSYRTSIHVHVNFVMDPFRVVYNFMTLCLILDELLVSQNGDHRIGNNFCLRATDAMGQVNSLIQSIESGMDFYSISGNDRYSSINFVSLLKFGTVEFRSLECTTHKGRLMHWINTLGRIKEASKRYLNPVEIISQFSQMGPKTFLATVLGPYAVKYLAVQGFEAMLHDGMRLAQDLAYCSSWTPQNPTDNVSLGEKLKFKFQEPDA